MQAAPRISFPLCSIFKTLVGCWTDARVETYYPTITRWRHGSVVRTLGSGWRTFLDLCL